jgi:RNA polymerase subunit RPABC4/transcription elongation factor Spt4
LGIKVWHGEAAPCVSCGELNRRSDTMCRHCGQDLSLQMITRMQTHAGPWYVYEHVRPFPGVTLERLVRQIRRGLLVGTTIVRGPTTYSQWRFAAETPGLSKYLGVCWNCQGSVHEQETYCPACGIHLDHPPGEAPMESPPPVLPHSSELERLSQAVETTEPQVDPVVETPSHKLPTYLAIAAILIIAMGSLLAVVMLRRDAVAPKPTVGPSAAVVSSQPLAG